MHAAAALINFLMDASNFETGLVKFILILLKYSTRKKISNVSNDFQRNKNN